MLQFDDESHLCWFRNSSVASDDSHRDFFLLGVICALAIYNDNIVDIRFPLALYKKLLGKKVDLSDLKELSPSVGRSMNSILQASEDDCIEDWGLSFSTEITEFGETRSIDLVPGGSNVPGKSLFCKDN